MPDEEDAGECEGEAEVHAVWEGVRRVAAVAVLSILPHREAACDYVERKRAGKAVELGKTVMNCEVCGKPFVVKGGGQRYCPDCAKAAYKESDRQQSRAWAQRAKEAACGKDAAATKSTRQKDDA